MSYIVFVSLHFCINVIISVFWLQVCVSETIGNGREDGVILERE